MNRLALVVTDKAIEEALELGVSGHVEMALLRMARSSAVCTHELGNRRYQQFVMQIIDDRIEGIALF